jgi:hypothetical protein
MLNIPIHNPQSCNVLQSKKENSTGEQTKNHDFIETYLVRQFATSHEPSMDQTQSHHYPAHFSVSKLKIFFKYFDKKAKPLFPLY